MTVGMACVRTVRVTLPRRRGGRADGGGGERGAPYFVSISTSSDFTLTV